MRNIPLIVKLFFLYYAVGLDAVPTAMIGLIVHQSGFIADVTAAGLRSVPREQLEGAYASGLSMPQVFVHVLLPQALSFVIPPLTSQFIELAKNTALVMLIGLQDLTFVAQNINVETYRYLAS
jgi:ABC-type amino acid transport system permease subunit